MSVCLAWQQLDLALGLQASRLGGTAEQGLTGCRSEMKVVP